MIKNFMYLIRKTIKKVPFYFLVSSISSLFNSALSLYNIAGIGKIVEALAVNKSSQKELFEIIVNYVLINLLISLFSILLNYANNYLMRKASNLVQCDYINDCVDVDYDMVSSSKILNLKKKSLGAHPAFFVSTWESFFGHLIKFIGVFYLFFTLTPVFVLFMIVSSCVLVLLNAATQKLDFVFKNETVEDERKLNYLYTAMTEYKYAKEIRINGAKKVVTEKYQNLFGSLLKKLKKLIAKKGIMGFLGIVINCIWTFIMYAYFSYEAINGNINVAEYMVLISSTLLLSSTIVSFFKSVIRIKYDCLSVDFYKEYINEIEKNSVVNKSNFCEKVQLDNDLEIEFVNVYFKYPNAQDYTLKNISFKISPKTALGIVGLNGSGKTTIIKLLVRLYEPTSGKILINGINIKDIPYYQYAENISTVLQDYTLFAYSIEENIIFDKTKNQELLNNSIIESGINEKVKNLEKGINTVLYKELEEDGIELSGGEGQKLAMSRAIYKNAKIIILDEPTSSLDPISEYSFFEKMYNLSKNKTTIFISHRLYSTKFCDKILVLDQGKIVEEGTHNDLIQKNGIYSNLYISQAKHYVSGEKNEKKK